MTKINCTVEKIEEFLKDFNFKTGRRSGWFEGVRSKAGFLRIVIDSETVNVFKLTANSCLEWKVELSLYTPFSILLAALTAALDEANS